MTRANAPNSLCRRIRLCYRRIVGELRKLRLKLGRSSVRRILKDEGLTPSPVRRGKAGETTWQKFIRLHVNTLVACDFFTKNVITPFGVRVAYCLVFIHVGTRKVFLSPPTYHLPSAPPQEIGPIRCQRFLGGLLRHYYRVAA